MNYNISDLEYFPSFDVSVHYKAINSAKKTLEQQKQEIVEAVIKFLQAHPGTYVTASAIALRTGMRPCVVTNTMRSYDFCSGVHREVIQEEHKYAELDKDGAPICGTERTKTVKRVAYIYYGNGRTFGRRTSQDLPF